MNEKLNNSRARKKSKTIWMLGFLFCLHTLVGAVTKSGISMRGAKSANIPTAGLDMINNRGKDLDT